MLYYEYYRKLFSNVAVSFFIFLTHPVFSFSQTTEADASFVLRGNTKLLWGKGIEGVSLELKKNGQSVTKILTGKNGKYSLQIEISILDTNNEYLLYILKEGIVPKLIRINTYISPQEYSQNTFPLYVFDLEIQIIETTVKDIVVEQAYGRIHWDNDQHAFALDQFYEKLSQQKENNPDKFISDKKDNESLTKKNTKTDSGLIAETDVLPGGIQKQKKEEDKAFLENTEVVKQNSTKKLTGDSLSTLVLTTGEKSTIGIKKFVVPVSRITADQNIFDAGETYSITLAKKSLQESQEKTNKEKAANLSAKYETNNTLTSLLNMVDEDEKKQKSKMKH